MTVETTETTPASAPATMARPAGVPREYRSVMSGMLLAALDQTIVGTIMPLTARQRRNGA